MTKSAIMEELSEELYLSIEAIKNWMYGFNGPSDIEQVKVIGDYFKIDYHELYEYFDTGYFKELREIFADYIVE